MPPKPKKLFSGIFTVTIGTILSFFLLGFVALFVRKRGKKKKKIK